MAAKSSTKQGKDASPTIEDEEDDYMNMSFGEPAAPKFETSLQRRARKQREADAKSRAKSKAEKVAEEAAAREAALGTSIDTTNKGFKMMQKLGFQGGTLGKSRGEDEPQARTEPISLSMKEDRGGVGMDSEKKRKIREQMEGEVKRVKADEGDYRDRLVRERELKRLEGQIIGAMSVAERLDEEEESNGSGHLVEDDEDGTSESERKQHITRATPGRSKPLKSVNVLWRASVRYRWDKERERRARYDLLQSLSRKPEYDDPEEDMDDRLALGKEEEELEEDDAELEEFLALEPEVRLGKLVDYLRTRFHYCFWCKYRYPDTEMEGCPGVTEEDHD